VTERLPNGTRAVAGIERIVLWVSIVVLVVGGFVSYTRVTGDLDQQLDRNCRILVRIDGAVTAVLLDHADSDSDLIADLRAATQGAPQEICG
jgi:hypothetical protein